MRPVLLTYALLLTAVFLSAQDTKDMNAEAIATRGIPARATSKDYQGHGQVGSINIGAEFTGHSISTPDGFLTTEDYVVVEVGVFGAKDAKTKLSYADFSLRINGKKPTAAEPYEQVFHSVKDPETEPSPAEKKSKNSINTGGGGQGDTPAPVHIPIEVRRSWETKVKKASLPEGVLALPQAGLLFFPHRGKAESIHQLELVYNGDAGKATITLQ